MKYWFEVVTFALWPALIWVSFVLSKVALRRFARRCGE